MPEQVLEATESQLRGAGLSNAKYLAIRDLALKAADGTVPLERIEDLADDDIVARLSAVRGIGRWTAEMFLMFQLGRLDVWPTGDLGVRAGYGRIFQLPEPPGPADLELEGDRFRPWRSLPSR